MHRPENWLLSSEKTREIRDSGERGRLGENVGVCCGHVWGGITVCGQRQCAFVPDHCWPYCQTNLWLGGVSVCVLSVGATERSSREEEKRASKNGEGAKEKKLAWKKVCETPWDSRKRQWPLQPQRFLCRTLLLAAAASTLMLTQTDRKERPSAVYSTVVSISHGRGQWEHSPFWAFSVCQHASHSTGCQ